MATETLVAKALSPSHTQVTNMNSNSPAGALSDNDIAVHGASSTRVDGMRDNLDNPAAGVCTPPDRLIPGSGGRYEDWPYHPSRLGATISEYTDDVPKSSDGMVNVEASTQTDFDADTRESGVGLRLPTNTVDVMVDEPVTQAGDIASVVSQDGRKTARPRH